MAGILNAQVQEWYKNNIDLLGVIEKLTNRCKKLEEENERLKDENKILKDEFDRALKDGHISVSYEYDIHTSTEREENERLRKKEKDYASKTE